MFVPPPGNAALAGPTAKNITTANPELINIVAIRATIRSLGARLTILPSPARRLTLAESAPADRRFAEIFRRKNPNMPSEVRRVLLHGIRLPYQGPSSMIPHHATKCRRMFERVVSFEGVYGAVENSVAHDSIDYLTKHTGLIISRILVDSSRSSGASNPASGCFAWIARC